MSAPAVFAILSDLPEPINAAVLDILIDQAVEDKKTRPAIIDLAKRNTIPAFPGKPGKEDPLMKYAHTATRSGVPVLSRAEASGMLKDLGKERNLDFIEDRTFLVLKDSMPADEALVAFDAFCFLLSENHASIPFIYAGAQAVRRAGGNASFRILLANEPRIERAAEFFVELRKELTATEEEDSEYVFCGALSINREELELAKSSGKSFLEAFPKGTTHGQARYAVSRLFARPSIDGPNTTVDRIRLFSSLLR